MEGGAQQQWFDEQMKLTRKREREEIERRRTDKQSVDERAAQIIYARKLKDDVWRARSRQKNTRNMVQSFYSSSSDMLAELGAYERVYEYTFRRGKRWNADRTYVTKQQFTCWGYLPSTGCYGFCSARVTMMEPWFPREQRFRFDESLCCFEHTCVPEAINTIAASSKRSKIADSLVMDELRSQMLKWIVTEGKNKRGIMMTANSYRRAWIQVVLDGECEVLVSSGMNGIRVQDGSDNITWGPIQYSAATTSVPAPAAFRWEFNIENSRHQIAGSCASVFVDCTMLKGGAAEFRTRLDQGDDDGGGGDVDYFDRWLEKYGERNAAMGMTYLVMGAGVSPLDVQQTLMHVHRVHGFFGLHEYDNMASAPHKSHAVFRIPNKGGGGGGTALAISTECLRRYRMLTLKFQPFSQSLPKAPLLTQFWTLKARSSPPASTSTSIPPSIVAEEKERPWVHVFTEDGQDISRPFSFPAVSKQQPDNDTLDLTRRYGMLATLEFIVDTVSGYLTNMRSRMFGVHEPYFKIYDLLPEILSMFDENLKFQIWNSVVLQRLRHNTLFGHLVYFICQRSARSAKSMKNKFRLRSSDLQWLHVGVFSDETDRARKMSARYPYAKYLLKYMVASGNSNGQNYTEISIPNNDWTRIEFPGTIPLPPKDCPLVYYLYELIGETELLSERERATIFQGIAKREDYTRRPRFVGTVLDNKKKGTIISDIPKKLNTLLGQYERKCTRDTQFPREQRHIPFTQMKRRMIQLDALYHTLLGMENTADFCPVDPKVSEKHFREGDPDPTKVWTDDYFKSDVGVYGLTRIADPVRLATRQVDMAIAYVSVDGCVKKILTLENSLYVHKAVVSPPASSSSSSTALLDAYVLVRDPTLVMLLGE